MIPLDALPNVRSGELTFVRTDVLANARLYPSAGVTGLNSVHVTRVNSTLAERFRYH